MRFFRRKRKQLTWQESVIRQGIREGNFRFEYMLRGDCGLCLDYMNMGGEYRIYRHPECSSHRLGAA